ncbi:MAG: hypothetical protein J6B55_04870 [Clostridia bacterium]|nr:hypothetical protein [Clostridia bacterium]
MLFKKSAFVSACLSVLIFVVKMLPNIGGGGLSTTNTFKDGALDNQLTFRIVIRCMRDGKMVEEIAPVLTDELIQKVYTNGTMIKLTVGGATDIFDEYVIAVEIASEVGVKYTYVHETPYVPAPAVTE